MRSTWGKVLTGNMWCAFRTSQPTMPDAVHNIFFLLNSIRARVLGSVRWVTATSRGRRPPAWRCSSTAVPAIRAAGSGYGTWISPTGEVRRSPCVQMWGGARQELYFPQVSLRTDNGVDNVQIQVLIFSSFSLHFKILNKMSEGLNFGLAPSIW